MFKLFKRKTELEKLTAEYSKLRKEAHSLSISNRRESDLKMAQSEEIMRRITELVD